MRFSVRHVTRFAYEAPITESIMEARMQPRSDGLQRLLHFALTTTPQARVFMYQDHVGNTVHHFDSPARHSRLTLTADALVECAMPPALPDALELDDWDAIDAIVDTAEHWESLAPSTFARPTPLLDAFRREIRIDRSEDPLTVLRLLMAEIEERFEYRPQSTRVDSPIDEALAARGGVCQDFAHIFIALARQFAIPARYVSGYLFHDAASDDRSSADATHAWAEAFLPPIGWVGFDPTNNLIAGQRHIRVAIGRDYADVPPTRGIYKGASAVRSELAVAVKVGPAPSPSGELTMFTPWLSREAGAPISDAAEQQQQQ
jgi:transglutaminase-like putative cysteine protease